MSTDLLQQLLEVDQKAREQERGTAEIRVKIGHSDTFFSRRYFSETFVT
ncbi:hypothetical protein IEK_05634 [Bacillus toyonensis]|nr:MULTISPECIES: hypothetical protein [Bacillus cereus group]EJV42799.1 hypothetical protein IEK_05634 [Bacillus toyonensis]